ncbi:alpha/beta hydrolase [Variovorax sp. J22P240]|nr:alpha/beta hydrolase [Variovorax sp. J22P240]
MNSDTLQFRDVPADDVRLHVALTGPEKGRLVILLHGFPEFWYAWRRLLAPLAAGGLRVAAPDQRGYGLSDKPPAIRDYGLDFLADDVLALASALGHERFSVVGHDWGGVIAWQLAARNPERIERAVILNAPHPDTVLRHALRHPMQLLRSTYVAFFQVPVIPEIALRTNDFAALVMALTHSSLPGTFNEDDLQRYKEAWSQDRALTSMLNWYRAAATASPCRERIAVPVRVIWGDKDSALERTLAEDGAARCDHAEVIHIENATHWMHHEEPTLIEKLVREFVAGSGRNDEWR